MATASKTNVEPVTQIQPTTDSSMSAALVTVIQAMMVLTMHAVSAMQTQATIVLKTATES